MRRTWLMALFSALIVALQAPARAQQEDLASPKLRIGWADFKKAYDAGTIEVIDVRGQAAFEAGHMPKARSVPLDDVGTRAVELRKLGKPLVVYCA